MNLLSALARSLMQKHWGHRKTLFDTLPLQDGDVVFLGDSITEQAEWCELFPSLPIRNRGIAGDTTAGVLERLFQITSIEPSAVFLMIGTNDVTVKTKDTVIVANVEDILTQLRAAAPHCELYLTGILPRKKKRAAHLRALNAQLAAVAERCDATFVDMWPTLADADAAIRAEFSNDHLHLAGGAFQLWAKELMNAAPILKG